jgi:hypothetical protein
MIISFALTAQAPGRLTCVVCALFTVSRTWYSAALGDQAPIARQRGLLCSNTPYITGGTNGCWPRVFTILLVYTKGFSALTSTADSGNRVGSYYDPSSECHFVVARPSAQPDLWTAYLEGARTSYRRFRVERVLEYEKTRDGKSTTLFFAAIDHDGQVAGGMRVRGP